MEKRKNDRLPPKRSFMQWIWYLLEIIVGVSFCWGIMLASAYAYYAGQLHLNVIQ